MRHAHTYTNTHIHACVCTRTRTFTCTYTHAHEMRGFINPFFPRTIDAHIEKEYHVFSLTMVTWEAKKDSVFSCYLQSSFSEFIEGWECNTLTGVFIDSTQCQDTWSTHTVRRQRAGKITLVGLSFLILLFFFSHSRLPKPNPIFLEPQMNEIQRSILVACHNV